MAIVKNAGLASAAYAPLRVFVMPVKDAALAIRQMKIAELESAGTEGKPNLITYQAVAFGSHGELPLRQDCAEVRRHETSSCGDQGDPPWADLTAPWWQGGMPKLPPLAPSIVQVRQIPAPPLLAQASTTAFKASGVAQVSITDRPRVLIPNGDGHPVVDPAKRLSMTTLTAIIRVFLLTRSG